ncbi:NfeD family protein [Anaeromyxobacter terrae]|uniref:NfeD family protein n=1 Tax=Anaeromyxobacter terrae TaxID=2925406 RepID=UPI001F5A27DE|nr:NfeD family protein [Anaeromyxobacter sp. SG22]
MAWWLWALVGFLLLVVELVTPGGLFALFFGAGALCVAVLTALGVGPIAQWLAFTAISLLLLATLRRMLQDRLQGRSAPVDSLVGEEAVLLGDLPQGGEAKAELRGVPWSARAASGVALAAGQRCRVERVEGLVLWLRPD